MPQLRWCKYSEYLRNKLKVHLLVRPKETRGDKHNKETYKKTILKTKAWTI